MEVNRLLDWAGSYILASDLPEWGMNVISIGNFDGVHLGHMALLDRARALAGGSQVTVVTFEPHPASIVRPDMVPRRLSTSSQRRELLLAAGADEVRELEPTPELLGLGAREFIDRMRAEFDFGAIVEGRDFRFARRRSAGVEELAAIGQECGFAVELLDEVLVRLEDQTEVPVRSTLIRWLLEHGRVVDAARALGRPYRISGTVVAGDKRGRTLGYPTANLDHGDQVLPADGVYAGLALLPDGTRRVAGVSVGTKPTFNGAERVAEAHLIDHDAPVDEYGWNLEIDLVHWLREQLRFDDVEQLCACMDRDCQQARQAIEEQVIL